MSELVSSTPSQGETKKTGNRHPQSYSYAKTPHTLSVIKDAKSKAIYNISSLKVAPRIEETPKIPQKILETFLSHQDVLDLQHLGLLALIWTMQRYMPCKASDIQRRAKVGRKLFWKLIENLENAGLVYLRYNRFSPVFHAFITPASEAQVDATPASEAQVAYPGLSGAGSITPALEAGVIKANESLINRDLDAYPGLRGRGKPSVVVVGSKETPSSTTQSQPSVTDVIDLVGDAIRDLQRVAPHVHAGMLIPHANDAIKAHRGDLDAASDRVRGAIWYLVASIKSSSLVRSPLGLLRQAIRDGLSAPSPSEAKKQAEKKHEEQPPETIDRSTALRDELVESVNTTADFAGIDAAIEALRVTFLGNPHLDDVVAEARRRHHEKAAAGGFAAAPAGA